SEAFQEVLEDIAAVKSVEVSSLDSSALATMLQTMSDLTSKAEGARKEYLNAYQAALESPETLGNQDIIESFEGLSDARRAALFDVISDFDEAEAFLKGTVSDTQGGINFEDAVRKSRDKVLADQKAFIDNLIEAAETALGTGEGEEEHINALKAAVLKAAIKGNTKLVNSYAESIERLLGGDFAGKAIQLAEEAAKAEFENRLRSSLNKARSSREDTKANKTQKDLSSLGTDSEEGRAQEAEDRSTALRHYNSNQAILEGLIAKQIVLREEALALSEGSKTITQASKDKEAEAVSLQVQINNVKGKVLGYQKEEARVLEKLAELDNSFLVEQAAVKEINRQISVAKKSQQQDVSKTAELIKEGFLIEQGYLTRREKFINEQLKNALKAEGFGQHLRSKSLDQRLAELDNQGGRDLIKDNTMLSGLVKEAIETRTKLTSAEESLRQQLDDTLRKPLDDNLKKAQSKLTKQHSKTAKLESQLGKASDQLKKARENLAKVYDKEAEDLQFFKALGREIAGEEAQQKGDAKELNKQARKAGT
ncbi:hypothetical protein KAU11_09160, partial [Candidatus Babeliales bacterium]|nr:hypothetical protein [Candidatus Babeliales bacterium]